MFFSVLIFKYFLEELVSKIVDVFEEVSLLYVILLKFFSLVILLDYKMLLVFSFIFNKLFFNFFIGKNIKMLFFFWFDLVFILNIFKFIKFCKKFN